MIGAAAVARGPVAAALLLLLSQGSRASSPKLYNDNVRVYAVCVMHSQPSIGRLPCMGPLTAQAHPPNRRPIVCSQKPQSRKILAGKFG
jgi:hypothetical protein